ncbi:MAG: ribosomal-protein-alanine N-acetyltransferase [Gammaproteobacteria bacterium]|nr:MAG: ribosomal-protein-alanine N-acetyltransferase [Gammaproteobacteria bacterium]
MITFSDIPTGYQARLLEIDAVSNPQPWSAQSLISSFKCYRHIGAFDKSELVAYLFYRVVDSEAEIIHFVCHKDYQGRGCAFALLRHFIDVVLKGADVNILHLEVRAGNIPALRLYRRLGFIETGRRIAYYRNKEDAILMRRYCR